MKQSISLRLLTILLLTLPVLAQQEKGQWRAANQTARTITGDVLFTDDRISINFLRFTISRARGLEPAETSAAFRHRRLKPKTRRLRRRLALPSRVRRSRAPASRSIPSR